MQLHRHPMHLVQLTEHQHNLDATNERFNISARDSPRLLPLWGSGFQLLDLILALESERKPLLLMMI